LFISFSIKNLFISFPVKSRIFISDPLKDSSPVMKKISVNGLGKTDHNSSSKVLMSVKSTTSMYETIVDVSSPQNSFPATKVTVNIPVSV